MKEHEILEIITVDDSRKVAAIDSRMVSTSPQYAEENALAYYIVINTWMLIIREFATYAWMRILSEIREVGLLPVIKKCQEAAERVVLREPPTPLAMALLAEIRRTGIPSGSRLLPELNIGRDPEATLLFLLRYPKRFSPNNADIVRDETLADFLAVERRTKGFQRSQGGRYSHDIGYSNYVLRAVRAEVLQMYDWDAICEKIESFDETDLLFSSGSSFDAGSSLGNKLKSVHAQHPEFFPTPFGVRVLPLPAEVEPPKCRTSKILAVPKSYKAARIIAMEDTYRNARGKAVEQIFRKEDRKYKALDLEDQSINQELALEGSVSGIYATLDAKHASDCISESLFIELFPPRYVNLVLPLLPTHYLVGSKVLVKHMSSTSGHTLTFRHESIVYKAIGLAASRINHLFLDDNVEAFAWAYGDDTIVLSQDAELAIEFFESLGLMINEDKSFFGSLKYRESCGVEYYNGLSMTGLYFPRFPIVGTSHPISFSSRTYNDEYRGKVDNAITMLIDLQKKLYPVSYPASRFLYSLILRVFPKMTASAVGTECPDLWEYDDLGIPRTPKGFEILKGSHFAVRILGKTQYFIHVGDTKDFFPSRKVVPEQVKRAATLDTYHYAPYVAYDGRDYTDYEKNLYEMYKYNDFLKNGPKYNSEFDRLLKVSSRPAPINEFFGKRRLAWRLQLI